MEKYTGKGSLWFFPLPICYFVFYPPSLMVATYSWDTLFPFSYPRVTYCPFPSIDHKLYILIQLEGMCPSLKQFLRSLPSIIRKKNQCIMELALALFRPKFHFQLCDLETLLSFELRFVFCVCVLPVLGLEENREFYKVNFRNK